MSKEKFESMSDHDLLVTLAVKQESIDEKIDANEKRNVRSHGTIWTAIHQLQNREWRVLVGIVLLLIGVIVDLSIG